MTTLTIQVTIPDDLTRAERDMCEAIMTGGQINLNSLVRSAVILRPNSFGHLLADERTRINR